MIYLEPQCIVLFLLLLQRALYLHEVQVVVVGMRLRIDGTVLEVPYELQTIESPAFLAILLAIL